jgi:hypothetical protein
MKVAFLTSRVHVGLLRRGAGSLPHNGSQLVDNAPYPYRLRA